MSLNLTKTLYKKISKKFFWLVFSLINTFISQIIRLYLLADLIHIIFDDKYDVENWFFVFIFLSRILYFLAIFRAGIVQS